MDTLFRSAVLFTILLGAAGDGAGATASVPRLQQVGGGAVGVAGGGQLVCPGGASGGGGSLAACGDVVAADGRDPAFLDGAPRALALWRPLDDATSERCYLAASTVQRWLDAAGQVAEASVPGQLQGIAESEELGTGRS